MQVETSPRSGIAMPVWVALVVCLVLFSEGAFQRLVAPEVEAEGNPILRFMWLPVYGVVFALGFTRAADIARLALRMPALVLLVMFAAISFLWSIDPSLSLRRGIGLVATTLFGLYLAIRFDWRELLVLFGSLWLGLCCINFVAGWVAPSFARDYEIHIGAWRGFWFEKNTMGGHMARASMIFGALLLVNPGRWRIWSLGLFLSAALVLLSTSTTSLIATLLAFGVVVAGWALQGRAAMSVIGVWGGVALAGALAAFIALQPEVFLSVFGKDPSLTGRTDIWSALLDAIAQRPLLGYGYGAFWGVESEPAYWVRVTVNWEAPTAHNGWLEITLALGLVGLACFAVSFLATLGRALAHLPNHRFGLYAVGFLAQLALFSISESLLMELNSFVWINYVAVAAILVQGLSRDGIVEHRSGAAPLRRRLRSQPSGLV
ncbi:MAG: O-antigen ligase [Pseudomonadota bacterium]